MINATSKLITSRFSKNVLALVSGAFIAQVISFAASPILTRLYTPENFGLFALFLSYVNIVSKVGTLCYERAIILPKNNSSAYNIAFLSLIILLVIALLSTSLIFAFSGRLLSLLKGAYTISWLYWVPAGLLLVGIFNIVKSLHIRQKGFRSIAFARIGEAASASVAKIAIALFAGATAGGLILGTITGFMVSLAIIIRSPDLFHFAEIRRSLNSKSIKAVAVEYIQFPLYATCNAILTVITQNLIVLVFSIIFSPVIVGLYSLGNRIIRRPLNIMSMSVQNVFFQRIAHEYNHGARILPSLIKTTGVLFITGCIPFLLLMIYAEPLFGTIFGKKWFQAGVYVRILSPWFLVLFAVAPANTTYEVFKKQHMKVFFTLAKALLSISAIWLGYKLTGKPEDVIAYFVSANVLVEISIIVGAIFITYKNDLTTISGKAA
ncbi:MAG: oligosaccharide flippase family protein [Deltaproteobacteria bacterium]|nr:oligosaccharide flippase family protein [Deltaproteobacteria bacterium]